MTTPLFSTYRQRENRVTQTFLTVLERVSYLNPLNGKRILRTLVGDSDFKLDTFESQVTRKKSVLDAKIGSGPAICIETKTELSAVRPDQIQRHLEGLRDDESLLVLTPDDCKPQFLSEQPFKRVIWSNFATLYDAVGKIIKCEDLSLSEVESLLLREFSLMLSRSGLSTFAKDRVMVIAAGKWAWKMYKPLSVYRCAVDKPMQKPMQHFQRVAFYADGAIQQPIPKIISVIDNIDITREEEIESLDSYRKNFAQKLMESVKHHEQSDEFDDQYKIMFLSGHDNSDTLTLKKTIENDTMSKTGRKIGFTQGSPRYVTLESLKKASKASELVRC